MNKLFVGVSALVLAGYAGGAWAQATDDTQEIIVTGTRTTGLKAVDSAAPVQVLDAGALKRVGQTDLIQALAQNVPSFTAQALGGDAANLTLSAALRGLSPNDTLVLVDGKRRHGTASLAVLGGEYQGGAAADLSFIPVGAIDHVEVLTDGAAAQYGSDAIAGVVNIILKKNNSGGNITTTGGAYYDQGGETGDISANIGLAPLGSNSYLNLTAESKFHQHSDRGNPDPRVYNHDGINNVGTGGANAAALNFPGEPNLNHISGDAMYHLNIMSWDAGYDFENGWSLYSFGTLGHKNGQAYENYRIPSKAPSIYPDGFNPKEELLENDYAATVGAKGKLFGFNLDLSTTYGKDDDKFHTEGSANDTQAAAGSRQTDFYDGAFVATQWTSNLDVTRDFDVHLASPLSVAVGVEQRRDTYVLDAGEPNSYLVGGAQSFPGLAPLNAGSYSRDNTGVYLDLALSPIQNLKLDAAGRYEHFSDFGSTEVGKFTARYDFTSWVALRGTISSGFRAPTLAEEYYTNVNVGPTSAFGQFGPDSANAKALGISGLKPEQSDNYSIGVVLHPMPKMTATIDAYDISLRNRIVGSGDIYGMGNPTGVNSAAVQAALLGFVGAATIAGDTQTGIDIFANGVDTKTQGVDFVVTYSENYGPWGKVDWSLSGDMNTTSITKVNPSPALLAPQALYNAESLSTLKDNAPKYRLIAGAFWTYGKFTVNARETFYGRSSGLGVGDDGVTYNNVIHPTGITDLEVSYMLKSDIKLTAGANNLFNQYPDKLNAQEVASYREANDNAAVSKYPGFSPFGINGGYYYGKITFTF